MRGQLHLRSTWLGPLILLPEQLAVQDAEEGEYSVPPWGVDWAMAVSSRLMALWPRALYCVAALLEQ